MVFNISRRDFLKKAGIATAATTFLPSQVPKADIKTGLALYTVRDEMMKDPDGTLSAITRTGYNWVEAANYSNGLFYNQKPAVFRNKVDSLGLKLISSHCSFSSENIDIIVSDTVEAGISYLVLPSLSVSWRRTLDGYKEAAGFFNRADFFVEQDSCKTHTPLESIKISCDYLLNNL